MSGLLYFQSPFYGWTTCAIQPSPLCPTFDHATHFTILFSLRPISYLNIYSPFDWISEKKKKKNSIGKRPFKFSHIKSKARINWWGPIFFMTLIHKETFLSIPTTLTGIHPSRPPWAGSHAHALCSRWKSSLNESHGSRAQDDWMRLIFCLPLGLIH